MTDVRFLEELGAEFERIGPPGPPGSARRGGAVRRLPAIVSLGVSVAVVAVVVAVVLSLSHAPPRAGSGRGSTSVTLPHIGTPSQPLSGTIPGKITRWAGHSPLSLRTIARSLSPSTR